MAANLATLFVLAIDYKIKGGKDVRVYREKVHILKRSPYGLHSGVWRRAWAEHRPESGASNGHGCLSSEVPVAVADVFHAT